MSMEALSLENRGSTIDLASIVRCKTTHTLFLTTSLPVSHFLLRYFTRFCFTPISGNSIGRPATTKATRFATRFKDGGAVFNNLQSGSTTLNDSGRQDAIRNKENREDGLGWGKKNSLITPGWYKLLLWESMSWGYDFWLIVHIYPRWSSSPGDFLIPCPLVSFQR